MFGRVLVGTDLSPSAATALALARRLAPGARMRLVHVVPSAAGLGLVGPDSLAPLDEAVRRNADDARAALEALARETPGIETAVLVGSVGAELAGEAESFDADLVVVGARGHSRVHDLLLGSVARSVVRRVRRSVLVARKADPVRLVAVGTDFSKPAEKAAAVARTVAKAAEAELVVFHAADPAIWGERAGHERKEAGAFDATLRKALSDFGARHLPGAREVLAEGRPVEAGARVVREARADLLVVGDHGPGAVERALLGSVAEGLAERAPCSVLVAR